MLSRLESSVRARREAGKTLLDGVHLVQACIASGVKPDLIVLRESFSADTEMLAVVEKHDVVRMHDALFDKISPVKSPTGILALISIPVSRLPACGTDFCIFLDSIQDPGNMGSILRSAAAAGAQDVFLSPGCADPWSPKVLRAGMGAHFGIRIHVEADIADLVRNFDGNTVAMALDGKASLFDQDLKGRVGFVIGNEGAGISDEIISLASMKCRIPMPGEMESLNAAAAAAICFFERVRQRA